MSKITIILIFIYISINLNAEPKYCKLSDKILFPYSRTLYKDYHLILEGHGGAMMIDIQKINAHYLAYERLNVNEARRLFVEVIEGLLCRYNQNMQIRPYLHNYPFTIENLNITIRFEHGKLADMGEEFVALVFVGKNNQLIFRAYDSRSDKYIPLYTESYEVARDMVLSEYKCL